jgi:hypothetical protein
LFGLPFLGVGIMVGTWLASALSAYRAAQQWEEVPAKITRAEMENEDSGAGGMTCRVKAEYEYHYHGRRYTGRRVSIHGGSDNIGSFWWDVYRQLDDCRRTRRLLPCYVDPVAPSRAVLYRGLRWEVVVSYSCSRPSRATPTSGRAQTRWPSRPVIG